MTRTRTLITALLAGLCLACTPSAPPATSAPQATPAPQGVPAGTATPDFDGDGRADLAVTLDTDESSGAVNVFYGSGTTATPLGTSGLPLARNLNGDSYTDLAVAHADGTVDVLFGAPSGLDASAAHSFGPSAIGSGYSTTDLTLVESPAPRIVLAANDLGRRGKLVVYRLGTDGLPSAAPTVLMPGSGKVPALGTKGAYLKALTSAGNRLFVGAPFSTVSGHTSAGAVAVLTFGADGVTAGRLLTRNTSGVAGSPAKNAYFGYSVAARDGYLAVGVRGDVVGSDKRSGSVQVFRLSSTKVTAAQRITQASAGVPGKAEKDDLFGSAVALGAACDGRPAVVVGGPGEVITKGHEGDGSVWVIPLARSSACPAKQLWEGHGLPGSPTYFRFVGLTVAVLRDAGATADHVAITGYGSFSEGPIGVLSVWAPQEPINRLRVEGFFDNAAGR